MIAETQSKPETAELIPCLLTARGTDDPRCTVGLLTWNAGGDGVNCVRMLLAQTESDLNFLWIDNASTDSTLQRIRDRFPDLPSAVVNDSNQGFCIPHNRMIRGCKTRYYLALNQDVFLAPDYIRRLCDWLDGNPEIAMASGVTLAGNVKLLEPGFADHIDSAGLAFPRARYHFHLGSGKYYDGVYAEQRLVSGIEGAAMLLRVEACRKASLDRQEVFPSSFFAYYEEIDLAHRLARIGFSCGVDGGALASHRGKGSGGFKQSPIRARFFANHWLTALRNDPWSLILREIPYWLRGELQYWLPEYLAAPGAFFMALGILLREAGAARKFYRDFEAKHGPTLSGLLKYREQSLRDIRSDRQSQHR